MKPSQRPPEFLQAVLEGFLDGIFVLTDQKQLLYANQTAERLCHRSSQAPQSLVSLPREVWQACEALIDSRNLYPDRLLVIESEVRGKETALRIQAQWLSLQEFERPCLLVRLQDQHQAAQSLAIAEAQTWGLTDREAQVWRLRRSGFSRKQIAAELHISEDTVKKHLGNIHSKRQIHLDEAEWQLNQNTEAPALLNSVV